MELPQKFIKERTSYSFTALTTGSSWTMNSIRSSCWNTSAELLNKSCNKEFAYQTLSIVDTIILPSMIGIICSMGLVGNILIVFTIIR